MKDLKKNLHNIEVETDLLGQKEEKLLLGDRIGFLPISVWRPDTEKASRLKKVIGDEGQTRKAVKGNGCFFNGKGKDRSADISIFNPDLAHKILAAYCPQNAHILDQFGGGGTRGFIAAAMGFKYTGVELRKEEVERIKKQMVKLDKKFTLHCGDSVTFKLPKDTFDFALTCPPYFDLEIYSRDAKDISNFKSYDEFLKAMKEVLKKNYEALKPGSLSVWVVGNFRDKKGNLRHFNGDIARLGQEVGFKLHDEIIWWGASDIANLRVSSFNANRRAVRVHEYLVILKKD